MVDTQRRLILKGSLAASTLAVGAGVLVPGAAFASWPEAAFKAEDKAAALNALFGGANTGVSEAIKIKAPDIAENGAVVPVTVETDLDGVQSILIFAAANQNPLIASFEIGENAMPFVSTRIKMAETSDVIAVVRTADGLLSNSKEVKVTIGGCGT